MPPLQKHAKTTTKQESLYLLTPSCMCMWGVLTCVSTCAGWKFMLGYLPQSLFYLTFERDSLIDFRAHRWAKSVSKQGLRMCHGPPVSPHRCWSYTCWPPCPASYVSPGDMNFGPHAFTAALCPLSHTPSAYSANIFLLNMKLVLFIKLR